MSGPLWLTPGDERADTLPRIPRQRPSWAAADPLEELAERLDDLIAAAVHPDEIAAILESDGMTDDHIRLTYGREDSFALAEELYTRVPRRFPEPPGPALDPWHTSFLGCLLRGLVFALPGLAYVLGAPLLAGPPDRLGLPAGTVTLLAGALVGWVWNQSLSHRAYSWLGLGDREAAGRALLAGAPAGALLGAAVAFSVSGPGPAAAFAAGQSLYLGAATVLLVLGRERALLYALLPMAAGAALTTTLALPTGVRIALLATSLLTTLALAAHELPVRDLLARLRRRRQAPAAPPPYSREAAAPQWGPPAPAAREPCVPRRARPTGSGGRDGSPAVPGRWARHGGLPGGPAQRAAAAEAGAVPASRGPAGRERRVPRWARPAGETGLWAWWRSRQGRGAGAWAGPGRRAWFRGRVLRGGVRASGAASAARVRPPRELRVPHWARPADGPVRRPAARGAGPWAWWRRGGGARGAGAGHSAWWRGGGGARGAGAGHSAWWRGGGGARGVASAVRPAPRVAASLPYGLFGLGTGVLVLHAALGDVLAGGPGAVVAAPSAVALTLSMGPAEWLLHRFRSDSLAGLRASTTPGAFWRATAGTLAECLTGYLVVLLALGLAGTALWPGAPGLGGVRLATLLLLGAVMWTGLLLQSFGAVLAAASVCGAAALAQTVALLTGAGSPQSVQLTVAGSAAAILAVLVCVLLGRATAHR
ncbi:hypothetical protein NLX86_04640 [Streptomyces sp. A3M-1-3]|uniref:hypothetical protein n=1 Tax=Streptomyces sp. A3M-1-3 TaxID=2962044 RepID=UPI0020B805DB|nr:hypothetical protein [Streptomyces sp. A3M-1-3]MCP3817449.1 hypothetical protein [Streptomyces sp. A3M-1-3]